MTLFWILAAVLTFAVVAVLLRPLVRPSTTDGNRADYDLEVYRDQLKELDREVQRGLITPTQAEAARAEIGRRLLAAGEEAKKAQKGGKPVRPRGSRALAMLVAVMIPVGALMVYVPLGRPNLPAQPLSARAPGGAGQAPREVVDAVAKLVAHLKTNPQDLQGWLMLGQVYGRMERWDDSLAAFAKAKALAPDSPEVLAGWAEAVTSVNGGTITAEAIHGFEAALAKDPKNARSRFYLGLERLQAGDNKAALDRFVALARETPADAPYLPTVKGQIVEVAQALGLDPATVMPKPLPPQHPTEADKATPEERDQMVRAMVEKLAAKLKDNPADADGWLRLAQSYDVLGEKAKAADALRNAVAQAPTRIDVKLAYAESLLADVPADKPGPLPTAFIQVMKEIQTMSPDNPDALWFLGLEAANTGKPGEARELWGRLLAKLDPKSEDYASLQARIEELR